MNLKEEKQLQQINPSFLSKWNRSDSNKDGQERI